MTGSRTSTFHLPSRRAGTTLLLAGLLVAVAAAGASAATITWSNPAGGAWSNAGNWSPNQVPAGGDVAVLPALSGAYQVTLDVDPAANAIQIAAGDPTLDMNAHSIAAVATVDNYGTISNFAGTYDSAKLRNHTGGTVASSPTGVITFGAAVWSDGAIVVGPGMTARISTPIHTTMSGTGSIVLINSQIYDASNTMTTPSPGTFLQIPAGFTVKGSGVIGKYVTNYGEIQCDATYGPELRIDGLFWNYGTVRVWNLGQVHVNRPAIWCPGTVISGPGGGTFRVWCVNDVGGSVDFRPHGRLVVDGGDLNFSAGTTVNGEVQRVSGTGAVVIGLANFQDMAIAAGAEMSVPGHADIMTTSGVLTNNGTLRISGSMNFGIIGQPDSISFGGTGTVVLEGGVLGTGTGAVLWNTANQTIQGCGTINPPFVNDGVVNLDCGLSLGDNSGRWVNRRLLNLRGGRLNVSGSGVQFQNHGTLSVSRGYLRAEKNGVIDNTGGVIDGAGKFLFVGSTTTAGTLAGGRVQGDGLTCQVDKLGTLKDVTLGSNATLLTSAGATTTLSGARFTNLGTVRVASAGKVVVSPTTDYVQSGGATALEGGSIASTRDLQLNAGTLRGVGTLMANVVAGGDVSPDPGTAPLRVQGNYRQLPGSAFHAVLGNGVARTSRLDVTGAATLDGNLVTALDAGYTPSLGTGFNVLSYGSVSGQLHRATGPTLDAQPVLAPAYGPNTLTLVAAATTGVGDPAGIPASLRFYASRGATGTRLVLELPEASALRARVYDATGREVARLADGVMSAGVHFFALDGSEGSPALATGMYFARLSVTKGGAEAIRTARVLVIH
jgi:hypothetical protein